MARIDSFDPKIIEAEENLLIDFHYLIQEMMSAKNVSRSELAAKAGISKARLSQILSNEANPTIKSMARLFHALGEEVCVSRKAFLEGVGAIPSLTRKVENAEWQWSSGPQGELRVDDKLVAVVKDTAASNDNYAPRFLYVESNDELSLEAA